MSETSKPAIKVLQIHHEAFSFLGHENILTDSSDFAYIWNNFFSIGGYHPILPYAVDTKPINVWYTNSAGQRIYFQGLFVKDVEDVPDGYQLANFPASDFHHRMDGVKRRSRRSKRKRSL